jgi:hypothetical protein
MNTGKLPGSITNVGQHAQAGRGVVQANEQPLKEQRKMPRMKAIEATITEMPPDRTRPRLKQMWKTDC